MPRGHPGSIAPHGTIARYTSHARPCRCEECREAMREYERRVLGRRAIPWDDYVAEQRAANDTHGRERRYLRGCRCAECKAAAAKARRERRQRAAA